MSINTNKYSFSFVLLVFLSAIIWSFSGNIEIKQGQDIWAQPIPIYNSPDTTDFFIFDVDVYNQEISIVKTHFDTTNSRLNYSEIFLLQKINDSEPLLTHVSKDDYPVEEQPTMYRSNSGVLHLFWGERRKDPEFEEFNRSGIDLLFNISTSIMHVGIENKTIGKPEIIYEGALSKIFSGNGDLILPMKIDEDENESIHLVVTVEGPFKDIGDNHGIGLGLISQQENGDWKPMRYIFSSRFTPDIAHLSQNNIVVAFRGADRFDQDGSSNDIFIVRSEDGGITWSEMQPVFRSAEQTTGEIQLVAAPDGTLHLLWTRFEESGFEPFQDEVWHSVSSDGGRRWSEPERFFKLEVPPGNGYHFSRGMHSIVDQYGQLHWTMVSAHGQLGSGQREERDFYYAKWSPFNKNWQNVEKLDIAERPLVAKLAFDKATYKLFLFWGEREKRSIYYTVRNIEEPISLPVVAESGPLKLHSNYPNPFNPSTRIPFTLEEPAEVELVVYDISGRQVLKKNLGTKSAGLNYQEINMEGMTSGTYIYEISVEGIWRQQNTMMFIK